MQAKSEVLEKENLDHAEVMCCSEAIFLPAITGLVISLYQKQKDTGVLQIMGKERGHQDRVEASDIQSRASFS